MGHTDEQSLNFNLGDSELTRSILQHNPKPGIREHALRQPSALNESSLNSSRFENALKNSQQMLEQAKLESLQMAEELRSIEAQNPNQLDIGLERFATEDLSRPDRQH